MPMPSFRIKKTAIPNPCYNQSTGKDCPERHEMCQADCKRWKLYKIFRKAEKRKCAKEIYQHEAANRYEWAKARRLEKMHGRNKK